VVHARRSPRLSWLRRGRVGGGVPGACAAAEKPKRGKAATKGSKRKVARVKGNSSYVENCRVEPGLALVRPRWKEAGYQKSVNHDLPLVRRKVGPCMLRCMHWVTPQERRALGQARRKQVGPHEHDALYHKARRASALDIVVRSMRAASPRSLPLNTSSWPGRLRLLPWRGAGDGCDLAQLPSTASSVSSVATPMCATWVHTPRPTDASSSTSTISTRPFAAPSSGI